MNETQNKGRKSNKRLKEQTVGVDIRLMTREWKRMKYKIKERKTLKWLKSTEYRIKEKEWNRIKNEKFNKMDDRYRI